MRQINLNITGLTRPQLKLFESVKRFIIAVWGRQSGKTTGGLYLMLARALKGRHSGVYWFVLQTHSAAEIAFNRFWDICRDRDLLSEKPNESEKTCTLINGVKIFFKSGQNFEDLRAETLDGVMVDEFRQQDPRLWSLVIFPMLVRFKAWAVVLTTSNGYEHSYDLWESAQKDEDWDCIKAPSTEAPWWTPEEVDRAKRNMSEDEFAQEIMAEFREQGIGRVYKSHGSWNHCEANPFAPAGKLWSPHLPIVVGLDFNVGLMSWELGQFKGRSSYFGAELAVPNTNTQECAPLLSKLVKGHPSGVILLGDASGKARRTASSGETDYSIILECLRRTSGIPPEKIRNLTPEANPGVMDRVNICNAALKDATGTVHARYNPKTNPALKRDLERVVWRQGTANTDIDKRDPLLTHPSDAWGYPIAKMSNAFKNPVGTMAVISR